jgi:hypothetical protein
MMSVVQVELVMGDITAERVDVIVNAAIRRCWAAEGRRVRFTARAAADQVSHALHGEPIPPGQRLEDL